MRPIQNGKYFVASGRPAVQSELMGGVTGIHLDSVPTTERRQTTKSSHNQNRKFVIINSTLTDKSSVKAESSSITKFTKLTHQETG